MKTIHILGDSKAEIIEIPEPVDERVVVKIRTRTIIHPEN
jgi:hypothetical protein